MLSVDIHSLVCVLAELYESTLIYFAISKLILDIWSNWFQILQFVTGHASQECQHLYSIDLPKSLFALPAHKVVILLEESFVY